MPAQQKGLIGWIILIILAAGIVAAAVLLKVSQSSLPGDLIYPLKLIQEDFQLTKHEFSFTARADIYLDMVQERLSEIKSLVELRSKDQEIVETVQRLLDVQTKAVNSISRAKDGNAGEVLDKLEYILQKEQRDLPKLVLEVSPPASDEIQKVIDQAKIDLQTVASMRR